MLIGPLASQAGFRLNRLPPIVKFTWQAIRQSQGVTYFKGHLVEEARWKLRTGTASHQAIWDREDGESSNLRS